MRSSASLTKGIKNAGRNGSEVKVIGMDTGIIIKVTLKLLCSSRINQLRIYITPP
jgi:hypothetical protein